MTVSIIIAAKTWQKYLEECVGRCLELDYSEFEILILPDVDIGTVPALAKILSTKGAVPIKIIPTGPLTPPKKRDLGVAQARGEIIAFIDDDAYPEKDWLINAVSNFSDPKVAAIGGPAITPPDDRLRQKASGLVYSLFLVGGNYVYRYVPKRRIEVDDFPSCNFLVRKSVFLELGGFQTNFWPGEDTKLCLDITRKLGKKIIYDPRVIVYHHRRPLFMPHLKQIANYALHRGYFVKRYPVTSFRVSYFLPSLFLFALVIGAMMALFINYARAIYLFGLSLYLLIVFVFSINRDTRFIPLIFFGIISTHLTYGFYFVKGLCLRKLKEERF